MGSGGARDSSSTSIRVLVAEDELLLRETLCELVGTTPGFELVAAAANAVEAVEASGRLHPDVALLDVRLSAAGGPLAALDIGRASPGTRIVALADGDGGAHVLDMVRSGAIGYVEGSAGDEIVDAIRRAARGQSSLSAELLAALVSVAEPTADGELAPPGRQAGLSHLVAAEEEERRRIAAEIHDDSIQVMTAASMRLQILRRELSGETQLSRFTDLQETVQLAIVRLRRLLTELHPPALDAEGVPAALRMHMDELSARSSTGYRLVDELGRQPASATRVTLYRIGRELLVNVEKHAAAANATVTLAERDGGYGLRVEDDGVGFEPGPPRPGELGLEAIRQRIELADGSIRIDSDPGRGTTVDVWIPELAEPSMNAGDA